MFFSRTIRLVAVAASHKTEKTHMRIISERKTRTILQLELKAAARFVVAEHCHRGFDFDFERRMSVYRIQVFNLYISLSFRSDGM